MKKILLTSVATAILALGFSNIANADNFSGNVNIWAWNINIPPLRAVAKTFMKLHPQSHIKITQVGHGQFYQKLSSGLIARGKGLPDAVLMEDDHFDSFVKVYPKSFVNISKMGFDKYANLFPNFKVQAVTYKSHMYGFPFDAGPAVIFYRRSAFAKAGIKPSDVSTWKGYLNAGKLIKAKTGKFMFCANDEDVVYRIMMGQYGNSYYDAKGNIDLRAPHSVNSLKFIKKMSDEGILHHIAPGFDAYLRDIASGNVVAIPSGIWLEGDLETIAPKSKGDWGVLPLPVNGDGDVTSAAHGGSGFLMLKKSKNKTLTYNFLKYFTTSQDSQLAAFKGGLFPTLNKVYTTKEFNKGLPFFKGQKVWVEGAKQATVIKPVNYTQDFYYANIEMSKLYSGVIFTGGNLMKRLDQAVSALKARTGRTVNQYK